MPPIVTKCLKEIEKRGMTMKVSLFMWNITYLIISNEFLFKIVYRREV